MKTNKISFTLLFIVLAAVVLSGCRAAQVNVFASGKNVTKTHSVSGFHAVHANGNGQVIIDRTGTESFEITMDDSLLPYMQIQVNNGTLYVQPKPNVSLINDRGYTVTMTARDLDELTLEGNSNARVRGIETSQWKARLNGNNFVKLEGNAARQDVLVAGNAVYNAEDLASEQVVVRAEGNCNVVIRVSDNLDATVMGLARVEYIGTPTVHRNVQGIATVKQRADY